MCGIAGILQTQSSCAGDLEPLLAGFQHALRHRGPDDAGLWINSAKTVGLGHTRLAILDLSPGGHQPMVSADGRYAICFNGEIYNFHEVRAWLEGRGHVFQTRSDTEVLLHLYREEGERMVERLRGMFAFCVWDEAEQTALLARDPLGIKPLYWHEAQGRLAFASELRALTGSGMFKPTLEARAVRGFLETGTVPEPLTLVKQAQMLEAGHTLVWQMGAMKRRCFWRLNFGREFAGDPVQHTREALLDSVQHHFVSDVPVGIFLSGGIDSTAVLALAQETGHQGLGTFSITVDDPAADEGELARRTAKHFGSDHHEMRLDAEVARGLFCEFLQHTDQPSIDGLNTFTVSSVAQQHGMKVVLSGLGGDELFGGYSSFTKIPQMRRLHPLLSRLPGLPTLLQKGKSQHRRMADYLRSSGAVPAAFLALRGIFSQNEAASLTAWITDLTDPYDQMEESNLADPRDQISALEITRYMRNQLLRDSDVMSMAHSLELRVPFVDRVLVEKVTSIPAAQRFLPNKGLLTAAVPEVPEWVVNQKKRGFLFPYPKWLGGDWGQALAAASEGAPVPTPQWYQKWSLFMLRHSMERLGLCS